MTDEVAIEVSNLSKSFNLPHEKSSSIKGLFLNIFRGKRSFEKQQVLDDVNFEIKKGEFFGIVGRNGSGKSTLLKMLAGIYSPDKGAIKTNGKLTPFIELGVGFSPELSGRENVFLNGALLGFSHKEMEGMYESIVEFAELEEHMDKKLKNYSSGMQVRLAFSIAVKAKNDILIFDEVLAVGDEAFQRKCMDVFWEYRKNKQTVVLVTHSMDNIRNLCTRALMLSDGKVEIIGSVKDVANAYLRSNEDKPEANSGDQSTSKIKITGCKPVYKQNETMKLNLAWPEGEDVKKAGVAIFNKDDRCVFASNTGEKIIKGSAIRYSVSLNLGPGRYYLSAAIYGPKDRSIEFADKVWKFTIRDDFNSEISGIVRLDYAYE